MLHSLNALPDETFHEGVNYLAEENPFGLAGPPPSFLMDLWRYDPCLVIFPSKEEPLYRLARRTEHGPTLALSLKMLQRRPDTNMFVRHRLQPVTSILPPPFVHWGPVLLKDLAERDTRRIGGARKAADALDAQDDDFEIRWRAHAQDEAAMRARASWRQQKWTRGETVDLGGRRAHHARTSPQRQFSGPAYRPANTGDGACFIGRDVPLQEVRPFDDTEPRDRSVIVAP